MQDGIFHAKTYVFYQWNISFPIHMKENNSSVHSFHKPIRVPPLNPIFQWVSIYISDELNIFCYRIFSILSTIKILSIRIRSQTKSYIAEMGRCGVLCALSMERIWHLNYNNNMNTRYIYIKNDLCFFPSIWWKWSHIEFHFPYNATPNTNSTHSSLWLLL